MLYRTDYHIHTRYSDGGGWPEDYIYSASAAGLSEIGFSDHFTLTPEQQDWSIRPELLGEYCERILRLKEESKSIIVRLGLEIDYFPGKEKEIFEISRDLPLDFIIGSVHYLDEEPVDAGPDFYKDKDIYDLFESYFILVGKTAATGLFDIIGHPDLVRIYRAGPVKSPAHLYLDLAKKFKKFNVAIELNTNGYNKPLGDFYPDKDYLHLFCEEGVPVCVNSDAHEPARVAQYFDQAYSLLIQVGYKEMALFNNRTRSLKSIS